MSTAKAKAKLSKTKKSIGITRLETLIEATGDYTGALLTAQAASAVGLEEFRAIENKYKLALKEMAEYIIMLELPRGKV